MQPPQQSVNRLILWSRCFPHFTSRRNCAKNLWRKGRTISSIFLSRWPPVSLPFPYLHIWFWIWFYNVRERSSTKLGFLLPISSFNFWPCWFLVPCNLWFRFLLCSILPLKFVRVFASDLYIGLGSWKVQVTTSSQVAISNVYSINLACFFYTVHVCCMDKFFFQGPWLQLFVCFKEIYFLMN